MCGRYTLTVPAEVVAEVFGVDAPLDDDVRLYGPRFNVAPTQDVPVIRAGDAGALPRAPRESAAAGEAERPAGGPRRRLDLLRWGLVPWWADDPSIGNRMINARSESAADSSAYRDSFRSRRCLVVADGFYEWAAEPGGKQPYWVHAPDGRPFAFAGLWSRWRRGGGEPLETFTILTRDAAPGIRHLHDRMPVILDPADHDLWLDPANDDPEALAAAVERARVDLATRRVDRRVNRPENDGPELLRERPPGPDDEAAGAAGSEPVQRSLFEGAALAKEGDRGDED